MMNKTDLVLPELEILTESVGSGRSGSLECNDITSVFAFLAFLFALLNFVVNMGGGRRRRGVEGEEEEEHCYLGEDQLQDPLYRSSLLSVYALYRGVLDYLDLDLDLDQDQATGERCGARVLCDAGHQAAEGELGPVIAVLGAHRAGWLFERLGVGSHRATVRAVTRGVAGGDCGQLYPCQHRDGINTNIRGGTVRARAREELERIRLHIRQLTVSS